MSTAELKNRIEAKKHDLMSRLNTLSADTRAEAREQTDKIKKALGELEEEIKDGWDKVSDKVSTKLNDWLSRN